MWQSTFCRFRIYKLWVFWSVEISSSSKTFMNPIMTVILSALKGVGKAIYFSHLSKWKMKGNWFSAKLQLMKNVTAYRTHSILITLERFLFESCIASEGKKNTFDRNGSVENLLRKFVWKTNFVFLFCFCYEDSWEGSCWRRCYKGLTVHPPLYWFS